MERTTYTVNQMANMIQAYEAHRVRHRESQKKYYERNAEARKAYATNYYKQKKARMAAPIETPAEEPTLPN